MFLSLNSVLLQGRVHWPDFARLAAQIGFPGTDIMLRPAMEAGVSATNDLLAGLKIRPAVIDFPVEFRKDDATFQTSLAQLDAVRAYLMELSGDVTGAIVHYKLAAERTTSLPEQNYLLTQVARLGERPIR